jgi:hypothetical protein
LVNGIEYIRVSDCPGSDKLAAENLAAAAQIMQHTPGAMQLRSLQTIDGLGASPSNTVIMFPVEWVELVKGLMGRKPGDHGDKPPQAPPAAS